MGIRRHVEGWWGHAWHSAYGQLATTLAGIAKSAKTDPESRMEVEILEVVEGPQVLVDSAWDWSPLGLRHCRSW